VTQAVDVLRDSLRASKTLTLEGVHQDGAGIVILVRSKGKPCCPACAGSVVTYHSRYQRRIRDLPWQGRPVRLHLRVRRFRCRNQQCPQKIFAERLPAIVAPRARETSRFREVAGTAGYALGGLPAHRLLHRLGIRISRDTILRRVKSRIQALPKANVRVLGKTEKPETNGDNNRYGGPSNAANGFTETSVALRTSASNAGTSGAKRVI
jgi:transposase